ETNPSGKVIWELASFQDPFRLLPPGEPLKLSDPMDVQRWVDTENTTQLGVVLVIHTLVADSGNTRVIEIVDKIRYQQGNYSPDSFVTLPQRDAQGQPVRWHHVLVWTSQTNAQGLKFRYRTDTKGEPFWTADPTSATGYKYVQGTVGRPPDYPIIHEIWTGPGAGQVVHELSGVTTVERTFRSNPADKDFFKIQSLQPQP